MNTSKWSIDPNHSEIQFKVKHLMITNVTGNFRKFDASAETEGENFDNAKIQFSAETDSLTTGSPQRDAHLKSADFFDAEKFPTLRFESSSMVKLKMQR